MTTLIDHGDYLDSDDRVRLLFKVRESFHCGGKLFEPEEIVIADPSDTALRDGNWYVCRNHGALHVKEHKPDLAADERADVVGRVTDSLIYAPRN